MKIKTPRWALPLLQPARYKAAYGGRDSGKSHFFAEALVEDCFRFPYDAACIREYQSSLKYSAKKLIESKIHSLGLSDKFVIQNDKIVTPHNKVIIFTGMHAYNSESIKSLEGFKRFWVEEARSLSAESLKILRPTARGEDVELWFSWNPKHKNDPVDDFFRGNGDREQGTTWKPYPGSILVESNYMDNPWLTSDQLEEAEYDKARDPEKYQHVWKGGYLQNSEARVFKNWKIEEFEAPKDAIFRLGADWGFSVDPTVLIRSHTIGRTLYIDYEAHEIGCEIENIPILFQQIPDSEKWPIVADSQRPDTIDYVKRNGYDKIYSAAKGAGSIEDGIEWLKNYDIIVHPRCKHTIDELTMYSYKTDKDTGKVLPILKDKDNHIIDALRYANEGTRRSKHCKPVKLNFTSEWS